MNDHLEPQLKRTFQHIVSSAPTAGLTPVSLIDQQHSNARRPQLAFAVAAVGLVASAAVVVVRNQHQPSAAAPVESAQPGPSTASSTEPTTTATPSTTTAAETATTSPAANSTTVGSGESQFIASVAGPSQPTTVVVINASGVHGTASELSDVLSAAGWELRPPGSATVTAASTIYFSSDSSTRAEELSAQLHIENRSPLVDGGVPGIDADPLTDLTGADLVVVVGEDFVPQLCPPPNDIGCVRADN